MHGDRERIETAEALLYSNRDSAELARELERDYTETLITLNDGKAFHLDEVERVYNALAIVYFSLGKYNKMEQAFSKACSNAKIRYCRKTIIILFSTNPSTAAKARRLVHIAHSAVLLALLLTEHPCHG